ncbi:MAG TPA: TolC family protein [Vitreimonas sp.]|uniref:TolC family protein n=1 Tax=Vitreimonas sp. TaxID=3069702 RepID=UPI002D3B730E|nr:TolC family protein [Vitreimonas sp.]HYD89753.1 TolC family protein [Vitreimonas sp.]
MSRPLIFASVALVALAAACASNPSPDAAPALQTIPPVFADAPANTEAAPQSEWWRGFGDETLNQLVARALTENRDLRAAEAEVRRARALASIEGWRLLPSGTVSAAGGRARDINPVAEYDFAEAGADISWELDVFGRLRHGARAAGREALSVEEARRGVRVAIATETAIAYASLRGAQMRLAAARANAESQRQTLIRSEALREAGRANPFDVARAREQYETTAAAVATIEGELAASRNALDVLVMGIPADLDLAPAAPPAPPASFNLGSPEELLQRRPDIRRARAVLEAATARTDAARVDWWPRLSLLGLASWTGADFGSVGDSDGFSFVVGPRIDWPALDVRRNALRTEAARANAEAEFHRYDQIVYAAVRDVETSLANLRAASAAAEASARAAEAAREAARISRLRYREGMESFFSVLDSERRVAEAEDRLALAGARRAIAYARLGQALGAGWSE